MGPVALAGDISQFYPSVLLRREHWRYQRILIREGLEVEGDLLEAVIVKLIFGVCSCGGQCEEVVKCLVEAFPEMDSRVKNMLLKHRYVDDFLKSVKNKMEADYLANGVQEALGSVNMKV